MRARTRNVMGRRALQKALLVCILATVTSLRAPTPALRSTHGCRYAANVWDDLPEPCRQALDARGLAAPLPVQTRSYAPVFEGLDAVVQSPTATGKTLAYVAPLVARLAAAERPPRAGRGPAAPRVLVLAPVASRRDASDRRACVGRVYRGVRRSTRASRSGPFPKPDPPRRD